MTAASTGLSRVSCGLRDAALGVSREGWEGMKVFG